MASLLNKAINTSKKQTIGIKKQILAIQKNSEEIPYLDITPHEDLNRLVTKINQEEYYLSYLEKFKELNIDENRKAFSIIYSISDFLHFSHKQVFETTKSTKDFDYNRKIKYNTEVEKLFNDVVLYDYRNKEEEKEFHKDVMEIISHFYKNQLDTFHYYQNEFVEKLKLLILQKYMHNEEMFIVAGRLRDLTLLYNDIHKQNLHYKDYLLHIFKSNVTAINTVILKSKNLLALINVSHEEISSEIQNP